MSRSDTERDIVETLGQVPSFFAAMPDETLAREWAEWKSSQLGDTALTARRSTSSGWESRPPRTARTAPTSTVPRPA